MYYNKIEDNSNEMWFENLIQRTWSRNKYKRMYAGLSKVCITPLAMNPPWEYPKRVTSPYASVDLLFFAADGQTKKSVSRLMASCCNCWMHPAKKLIPGKSFSIQPEFRKFLGIAGDPIDHGNWSEGINLHHNENYCTDKQEKTIGT